MLFRHYFFNRKKDMAKSGDYLTSRKPLGHKNKKNKPHNNRYDRDVIFLVIL